MNMHDDGCAERERMVLAAATNGWIQHVAASNAERHALQPAVLMATAGVRGVPGPFGDLVRGALQMLATQPPAMRQAQRDAGCPPFVVFGVPLVVLCQVVPADTAEDLRMVARENDYAVLSMNGIHAALVSGISKDAEAVA